MSATNPQEFQRLCDLFDLSTKFWRWMLHVDNHPLQLELRGLPGEYFAAGGTHQPTVACTRLAAILSLAEGNTDDALRWAHAAGARVEQLRHELQELLAGRIQPRRPLGVREIRIVGEELERAKRRLREVGAVRTH